MSPKNPDLAARNFPTAEEEAAVAEPSEPTSLYAGPDSSSRLAFVDEGSAQPEAVKPMLARTDAIQRELWAIAVANGRRDLNSDVAALYLESLGDAFTTHASRVAVGLQLRIPPGVWLALYALIGLGTMSMGYHTGISGSKRAKAIFILAFSFALVISVIVSIDRPGGHVRVTQQPLADLRSFMAAGGD